MHVPILRTKLYIPQAQPGGLVDRPRLIQQLNEGLNHKLTLISAPAGYGKTTLVSQWLNERMKAEGERMETEDVRVKAEEVNLQPASRSFSLHPPRAAWLSLDNGDSNPVRFWTYVIAALETIQAGVGANALPLLHSPQASPLDVVLTFLLNDLATISHDFVLVLDDYHRIENSDVHLSLTFLLDYLPLQGHVIIVSRADPLLPLSRWRVKRQLTELRAEELRFTPDETALFFNQLSGLYLLPDQIAALEAKTEGWIAGLQLAAVSLQGHSDIESFITAFKGNHRYILDYMSEEILLRQPENIQSFLFQTAILERLTGSLCDAVTGRTDGQAMLEQLARANLFVIPLDDQGHWYRYHQLFADLLRHHLQPPSPMAQMLLHPLDGGIGELHRRAAAWYEQASLIEEAFPHAIAAQDFERAGRLIIHQAKSMISRGEAQILLRWFKALPEPWVRSQLKLSVLYAWLLFLIGHFDEVQQKLEELDQTWNLYHQSLEDMNSLEETIKPQELARLITGLKAQVALIRGEFSQAIALSEQALADLPAHDPGLYSIMGHNLALAYWLNGEPEKANQLLAGLGPGVSNGHQSDLSQILDGLPQKSQPDDPDCDPCPPDLAALIALSNLAELKHIQGQYRQTFALYQQLLRLTAERQNSGWFFITGPAHTGLGRLLYEWNDLSGAETHLRQGLELGNHGMGFRALLTGYMGLSAVLLAQGNLNELLELIEQAEQLAQKLDSTLFSKTIVQMRVRIWIVQGNLAAIRQWQESNGLSVDDEFDRLNLYTYIELARAFIAQGELYSAEMLLARLLAYMQETKRSEGVIKILGLQALTWQAQNKLDQALATLQQTLTLAEPEGYIRTFVDEGVPMAALLTRLNASYDGRPLTNTQAYVHKLLAAFGENEHGQQAGISPGQDDHVFRLALPAPAQAFSLDNFVEPLTDRELEVLKFLTTGLSVQEIADTMVIARSTLKTHLKRIYSKLEVHSRPQAVVKARELNLFNQL